MGDIITIRANGTTNPGMGASSQSKPSDRYRT